MNLVAKKGGEMESTYDFSGQPVFIYYAPILLSY